MFFIIIFESNKVNKEAMPAEITIIKRIVNKAVRVYSKFKLWIATEVPERGFPIVHKAIIENKLPAVVIPPIEIIKSFKLLILKSCWLITVT